MKVNITDIKSPEVENNQIKKQNRRHYNMTISITQFNLIIYLDRSIYFFFSSSVIKAVTGNDFPTPTGILK
ncbi:hypothetical protein Hanom_Chr03g00262631 [Helianthus anomalus]